MQKRREKIALTDDQLETLARLGVDLKGRELRVSLLAGMLPVIRPADLPDVAAEEHIICVSGC